jgi:general L-amino acid transport system permease protein
MQRLWNNIAFRSAVYQAAVIGGIAWLFYVAVMNAVTNLRQRGVSTGFSFLRNEAGISISETPPIPSDLRRFLLFVLVLLLCLILFYCAKKFAPERIRRSRLLNVLWLVLFLALIAAVPNIGWTTYQPSDPYSAVLLTGMVNSLRVAAVSAVGAVLFGFVLGICQLSTNALLRNLVTLATETARNVPLLLHALFWYTVVLNSFPPVRASIDIGSLIFLSNRGVFYPTIIAVNATALTTCLVAWAIAFVLAVRLRSPFVVKAAVCVAAIAATVKFALELDVPRLSGFNFTQGGNLSPEQTALVVGLVVYYAAFIADIVRSAIRAIPVGQWEGASSLGLSRMATIWLVIIPQALRIIIPPLSNQMLGLVKDTSIGVAIAFPEFVAISRTVINQTGQALEVMCVVMIFFLLINFSIAFGMNVYNRSIRFSER